MHKDLYPHLNLEELKKEKEFLFTELEDFSFLSSSFNKEEWESERNKTLKLDETEQNLLLEDIILLRNEYENRIEYVYDRCLEVFKRLKL